MMLSKILNLLPLAALFLGASIPATRAQVPAQLPSTYDQVAEQTKLSNAITLWNSRNVNFYSYQYTQDCNVCASTGFYPWRVQVPGPGQAATGVNNKNAVPPGLLTIPQLFSSIQTALTNPTDFAYATYDPTYGFPVLFQIQFGSSASNLFTNRVSQFAIQTNSPTGLYQTNRNVWNAQRNGANVNYNFQYTNWMDQDRNIQWPLTVQVRGTVVAGISDANGNPVSFLLPLTIDGYFDLIQRTLTGNGPWIQNTYVASVGYPDTIDMVSTSEGAQRFTIQNYVAV